MSKSGEWDCYQCKKEIKTEVIKCIPCVKKFHPGCALIHKVYNRDNELIICKGVKETIKRTNIAKDKQKTINITGRKESYEMGRDGEYTENERREEVFSEDTMEENINKIVRIVKVMKDEMVGKQQIRRIVQEVIQSEMGNIRKELDDIKQVLGGITIQGKKEEDTRTSYAGITAMRKPENIIIIKPKIQQESEETKSKVIEKVNIKSIPVGISKLAKGNKGSVIIGCESGKEIKELKETVDASIGKEFNVIIPKQKKPKIKIIGVDPEDTEMTDELILNSIRVQNKLPGEGEKCHLKILKRNSGERRQEETERRNSGTLIIETDVETHKELQNRGIINLGWRKCRVYDFVSVLRCFKCWGFNHLAKYCKKEEVCQFCAGNHNGKDCNSTSKCCVNCMNKSKKYNNTSIQVNHDALDKACPTYVKRMKEEKSRSEGESQ